MKRSVIAVGVVLMLVCPLVSSAEDDFNFFKSGYSYFRDSALHVVGLLNSPQTGNPPIDFDFDSFEISWTFQDMDVSLYEVNGSLRVWHLDGGRVSIHQDPGFDFDLGYNPDTGLATASNGELILYGILSEAAYFYNTATDFNSITFYGSFTMTGGTRFHELGAVSPTWFFFTTGRIPDDLPSHYHSRVSGRDYADASPAHGSSWSAVKGLY